MTAPTLGPPCNQLHHPVSQYPYGTMDYQMRVVELETAKLAEMAARMAEGFFKRA